MHALRGEQLRARSVFLPVLIIDIYSRKIVGSWVAAEEWSIVSSALIKRARARARRTSGLPRAARRQQLPDEGSTMLATLHKLGVLASSSRPRASDDNPCSEALFRPLKYRPGFRRKPFQSVDEVREWVAGFVAWNNAERLHGDSLVTPDERHAGVDKPITAACHQLYLTAYACTLRRWHVPRAAGRQSAP